MYDCLREARAPAAVLSFVIFRTHLDKAKHYKRLWVFIYIGSFLRHAPTPLMGVGSILWISSVVIGIPFVVFKLDRKVSYNDCKNSYAWTLSGTITGTPGARARAHARARGNSRSHACPAHAAVLLHRVDPVHLIPLARGREYRDVELHGHGLDRPDPGTEAVLPAVQRRARALEVLRSALFLLLRGGPGDVLPGHRRDDA